MTTSKFHLISVLFNIVNANQSSDPDTVMMGIDAILVGHFVTWREPTDLMKEHGDGSGTTRGYFKQAVFAEESPWANKRYMFSLLAIRTFDFTLYELKKSNGNLELTNIY